MFNTATKFKIKMKQTRRRRESFWKKLEDRDMNAWDRQRKSVLDGFCCWEDKSLIAAMHSYEVIPDGAIWWIGMGAQDVRIKMCICEVRWKFTQDFKRKVKSYTRSWNQRIVCAQGTAAYAALHICKSQERPFSICISIKLDVWRL